MLPDGYEVRPSTWDDQAAIAELVRRYDVRDGAVSDFTYDDLTELWHRPHLDMQKDTWLVTRDQQVAGYAMFWHTEPQRVMNGFGVVDPEHCRQGIGIFLASSIRRRVAELAAELEQSLVLRIFAEITDPPARELLAALGMKPVRRHYTMLLDLDNALGLETEPPYGIQLRPCNKEDARTVHEVFEESFAEHWGHSPESFEDWSQGIMSRDDCDPSLWLLAWDGEDPAGVLVAQNADNLGWVAILGVRSAWRGRGIGAAMLRTSFAEFKKRGVSQVGLGVDASNETGAVALYERVGMHVAKGYESFEETVSPTSP